MLEACHKKKAHFVTFQNIVHDTKGLKSYILLTMGVLQWYIKLSKTNVILYQHLIMIIIMIRYD